METKLQNQSVSASAPDVVELVGALHLHTRFSDGGVTMPMLVKTAQKAGLDYIAVTDHMTLAAADEGWQGFNKKLMVLVGYEHNDSANINHLLALNVPRVFGECNSAAEYARAVVESGGAAFLAHPFEKRSAYKQYPPYPWTDWSTERFHGLELWNLISEWMEGLNGFLSFIRLFYPRSFLRAIPSAALAKWDELNKTRFVSGIGGVDAHTRRIGIFPFSYVLFPIKVELKSIRTHLYLDGQIDQSSFEDSADMVITALKEGRGFICNWRRGEGRGTRMYVDHRNGTVSLPGLQKNVVPVGSTIHITIPSEGTIRFICDGKTVAENTGLSGQYTTEHSGVYRIEVYKKKNAWIYSNPFAIGFNCPAQVA